MAVHVPFKNGFAQRLVLYKTLKNSNIQINRKILLSNGRILICVRIRYHKMESGKRKFYINSSLRIIHIIYMKILLKFDFFTYFFSKVNIEIFFTGKIARPLFCMVN